ncbi:hypothetical protein ACWCQK_42165 [Streptomyces sp. NPDC002306]
MRKIYIARWAAATAAVALLACSGGVTYASDDPREPTGDEPNQPNIPDPPTPSTRPQPLPALYKVRVTLGDFAGVGGGLYNGNFVVTNWADRHHDVRTFGYVTRRFISARLPDGSQRSAEVGNSSSNSTVVDSEAEATFRATWRNRAVSIGNSWEMRSYWDSNTYSKAIYDVYGHFIGWRQAFNPGMHREIPLDPYPTFYSLASNNPGLCVGDVGVRTGIDPRCGMNNNVIDLWVTGGKGFNVTYSVNKYQWEYENNTYNRECRGWKDFGVDANELNKSFNDNAPITTSISGNRCKLHLSVKVLEKRPIFNFSS